MLRRVFALVSIASVALALAGATLWVRSFRTADAWDSTWVLPATIVGAHEVVAVDVYSSRGIAKALVMEGDWPFAGPSASHHTAGPPSLLDVDPPGGRTLPERLGFWWSVVGRPMFVDPGAARRGTTTRIALPDWTIVVGNLILPACWLVRRRRWVGGFEVVCNGEPPGEGMWLRRRYLMGHLSQYCYHVSPDGTLWDILGHEEGTGMSLRPIGQTGMSAPPSLTIGRGRI